MKKWFPILAYLMVFSYGGCGGSDSGSGGSGEDTCLSIADPLYHISYYEMCGNAEQPIANGKEKTVTLWFEVDSPISVSDGGKVFVDDLYLERSDKPGVNLLANASFENGLWAGRKNNAMCLATDTYCQKITETDDTFAWQVSDNAHLDRFSASADMSLLGKGYQTHIFHALINIEGIAPGTSFKAHGYIKVEGQVQARLGIDFREAEVGPNPRLNIRAVNGIIQRGITDGWIRINLRK